MDKFTDHQIYDEWGHHTSIHFTYGSNKIKKGRERDDRYNCFGIILLLLLVCLFDHVFFSFKSNLISIFCCCCFALWLIDWLNYRMTDWLTDWLTEKFVNFFSFFLNKIIIVVVVQTKHVLMTHSKIESIEWINLIQKKQSMKSDWKQAVVTFRLIFFFEPKQNRKIVTMSYWGSFSFREKKKRENSIVFFFFIIFHYERLKI